MRDLALKSVSWTESARRGEYVHSLMNNISIFYPSRCCRSLAHVRAERVPQAGTERKEGGGGGEERGREEVSLGVSQVSN